MTAHEHGSTQDGENPQPERVVMSPAQALGPELTAFLVCLSDQPPGKVGLAISALSHDSVMRLVALRVIEPVPTATEAGFAIILTEDGQRIVPECASPGVATEQATPRQAALADLARERANWAARVAYDVNRRDSAVHPCAEAGPKRHASAGSALKRRRRLARGITAISVIVPVLFVTTGTVRGVGATVAVVVGGVLGMSAAASLAFTEQFANKVFAVVGLMLGAASVVLAVLLAPPAPPAPATTYRYFVSIPLEDAMRSYAQPTTLSQQLTIHVTGQTLQVLCLVADAHLPGVMWAKIADGTYFPVRQPGHVFLTPGADGVAPRCAK